MHALTTHRASPYVWVSWITRLISGESTCLYSAWVRARHDVAKLPSDFDKPKWMIHHTALLRQAAANMGATGYDVRVENQNKFTLRGLAGTLGGKPALICTKGPAGVIVDAKTGTPRTADVLQVMVYMWAVPLALPQYKGIKFDDKVVYKNREQVILADEVDRRFVSNVAWLMKTVCAEAPPPATASSGERRSCPITPEDCPDRAAGAEAEAGESDVF